MKTTGMEHIQEESFKTEQLRNENSCKQSLFLYLTKNTFFFFLQGGCLPFQSFVLFTQCDQFALVFHLIPLPIEYWLGINCRPGRSGAVQRGMKIVPSSSPGRRLRSNPLEGVLGMHGGPSVGRLGEDAEQCVTACLQGEAGVLEKGDSRVWVY